jgi:hypothetical protein
VVVVAKHLLGVLDIQVAQTFDVKLLQRFAHLGEEKGSGIALLARKRICGKR